MKLNKGNYCKFLSQKKVKKKEPGPHQPPHGEGWIQRFLPIFMEDVQSSRKQDAAVPAGRGQGTGSAGPFMRLWIAQVRTGGEVRIGWQKSQTSLRRLQDTPTPGRTTPCRGIPATATRWVPSSPDALSRRQQEKFRGWGFLTPTLLVNLKAAV